MVISRMRGEEQEKGPVVANIVVAVNASKEIPKTALIWALTHIVQPGDTVTLLALLSSPSRGRFWRFGCTTSRHTRSYSLANADEISKINDRCSRMILKLRGIYDATKIDVKVKTVSGSPSGVVAAEAKIAQANWVVLDRLKHEKKHCLEKLQCNLVVMKQAQPKVLRLNLIGPNARQPERRVAQSTSTETFTATEVSDSGRGAVRLVTKQDGYDDLGSEYINLPLCEKLKYQPWIGEIFGSGEMDSSNEAVSRKRRPGEEAAAPHTCSLREVVSLARKAPPGPPPLCSVCKLKAPAFGHPPRWFTYADLEVATAGFSEDNFLAEGGYGSVHRGVLPDGLAIAVKQNKLASTQSDKQFCAEVEVLSRAQHRNVVMLVGFCIEDGRRLLVYEYICNGALDSHLYGGREETLPWSARRKIAVGAARGLRYLHEECRVGCIVHRDMRPNNILLTHDFEPLVGDLGLARWQTEGQKGVDTKVVGTFGYLAPEYTQSGQITEKADVYSFGVVLVELTSGLKAVDIDRPRGQHCLAEWARPLLETQTFGDLIDPRLGNEYVEHEVYLMLYAASLCLRNDPHTRPRMAQVLRILEGHTIDPFHNYIGSDRGKMWSDHDQQVRCFLVTNESPRLSTKRLLDSARTSTDDH